MDPTREPPPTINLAVMMLWASLLVYLLNVLIGGKEALPNKIVLTFDFGLNAFLFFKISAGRNWARIAVLTIFLLTMFLKIFSVFALLYAYSVPALFQASFDVLGQISSLLGLALSLLSFGLAGYALHLLFKEPGSNWFRKAKQAKT